MKLFQVIEDRKELKHKYHTHAHDDPGGPGSSNATPFDDTHICSRCLHGSVEHHKPHEPMVTEISVTLLCESIRTRSFRRKRLSTIAEEVCDHISIARV